MRRALFEELTPLYSELDDTIRERTGVGVEDIDLETVQGLTQGT